MSDTERLLVSEDDQETLTVNSHSLPKPHTSVELSALDREKTSSNTRYVRTSIQPSVTYYSTVRATANKPENYLELSVFILLCCSFLPGLVALAFSIQSKHAWAIGNYGAARENARYSLYANCFGIVVGISSMALAVAYLGIKFTKYS